AGGRLLPGRRDHRPVRRGQVHRQRTVPLCLRSGAIPGSLQLLKFLYPAGRHPAGARGGTTAMGTATGREGADLSERLFREPYRFDFFQAVRLLERLLPEGSGQPPAGGDGPPEREAVRFRATPALSFPASAVAQLRQAAENGPAEMAVS